MYYNNLRKVEYKTQSVLNTLGDGVNTYGTPLSIKPSEARDALNLSSRKLPALCTRLGRTEYAISITTPKAMGVRNNQYIHVQDGTTWKYWDYDTEEWVPISTTLESSEGKILDFAIGLNRYTVLMNGTDRYSWDGTTATELTEAPETNMFVFHNDRAFALKDNTLYFSKLEDITDWTTIELTGSVNIANAKGAGTALATYNNYVTVFTEHSIHLLYGTDPSNFELVDMPGNVGCISDRSVAICNNILYFVSFDGVYAFKGSEPIKISHKVDEYFKNMNLDYKQSIVASSLYNDLFIAIPSTAVSTYNDLILRYNTIEDKWYPESGNIVNFVTVGNKLYGMDKDGTIMQFDEGTTDCGDEIEWYWESAPRFVRPSAKQTLSCLWLLFDTEEDSNLSIYISNTFDSDDWKLVNETWSLSDEQNKKILIPITCANDIYWYRIKFVGTGYCMIHYLEEVFRIRE